jgi:hypothetical protein
MLTEHYELVREASPLAAMIYKDRKYYYQTFKEIAQHRNMSVVDVKMIYGKAKWYIRNPDQIWLDGLSKRARKALDNNTPYSEFNQLLNDVMSEKVDLECFRGIGHKIAVEIRRWCVNHS